jgi:hypothetical protein
MRERAPVRLTRCPPLLCTHACVFSGAAWSAWSGDEGSGHPVGDVGRRVVRERKRGSVRGLVRKSSPLRRLRLAAGLRRRPRPCALHRRSRGRRGRGDRGRDPRGGSNGRARRRRTFSPVPPAADCACWVDAIGFSVLEAINQPREPARVTGRQGRPRPVRLSCRLAAAAAYPTGVNPSFADGTHSSWKDVIVKTSVSNWLKTPNVVASVRCGPKIS